MNNDLLCSFGEDPPTGIKLLPYQIEGVDFLKSHHRAGLFDDMGLGKTYQALFAAKEVGFPTLVIGPPMLKTDWLNSAKAVGAAITYVSFVKIPEDVEEPTTLILEEAHWAQGGLKSKRGSSILALVQNSNVKYLWLLTGTPMRSSRPVNFLPLAELLGIVPNLISRHQYLYKFCAPRQKTFGGKTFMDYNGSSNLKDLRSLIQPYILRRTKAEKLDLPPKTYQQHSIQTSSKAKSDAKALWSQIADRLQELGHKGSIMHDLTILMHVNAIRAISEADKIKYTQELREATEAPQLYFFTRLEAAKVLAKEFECPLICGETPQKDRDKAIAEFQSGILRTLVLTIRAAGVGITLTAAEHVVFVGREWAPEDNSQAEDRAYRIGQTKNLTVHILSNCLDSRLENLLNFKQLAGKELNL